MNGIINIYKEKGYTSSDVVSIIRKILNIRKAGHTGTLDPEAEGVLPICIGKATKISEYITSGIKRYTAELTLGITTTTQDQVGEIISQKAVDFDKSKIKEAVNSFKGYYKQIPPMYSAIKIDGKKLYQLAREGKTIERKPREVTIFDIDILDFIYPNKIIIDVCCSKGTYIRTLCEDIGNKLNCGGHMSYLIRTQSGKFFLKNSIKLEQLKICVQQNNLNSVLINIDDALDFKKVYIKQNATKALDNGNIIYSKDIDSNLELNQQVLVYDYKNCCKAIYKVCCNNEELCIKPLKILI